MRKLILVSILSLFSAFAFSQEAPRVEVAAVAASSATTGSQPVNVVDAAARSFGTFLGRMAKTPVDVVASVASGVRDGFNATSAPATAAPTVTAVVPATAAPAKKVVLATYVENERAAVPAAAPDIFALVDKVSAIRSQFLSFAVGTQAPAPVEDRSVPERLDF